MILRVKKRGDGRSALPTVRFEGKRPLVKGAPGSFLGGAPALWLRQRRSTSKRFRRRQTESQLLSARVVGGEGGVDGFGEWGGGKDGFCGGWFCILFSFGFLSVYIQKKKTFVFSRSKIQIVITFTASAFTSPQKNFCFL